jgi:hypothetical protein
MVLIIMAGFYGTILDVRGAFLNGIFEDGIVLYMHVPQGFEKYYPPNHLLKLLRTIYGLKQAAIAFWKEVQKAFLDMGYKRSKADPCLYYKWTELGLVAWVSWVDDFLIVGAKEAVMMAKEEMIKRFECDDVGELKEYVGCKVTFGKNDESLTLTQPVLLQSFVDEFSLPEGPNPETPAAPDTTLKPAEKQFLLPSSEQTKYRSGVGKMLHMMRWSRPDTLNAVRELSRYMSGATRAHMDAMKRVMKYCCATPDQGLTLFPDQKWNGNREFQFTITGWSDSEYARDEESRRSVNGWSVFLNGAPVIMKSKMMNIVALSVTEAELSSATQCAQDMMFTMRIMESMGLSIHKPMKLYVDNKGAVDLANNWSVGGRTRHIEVREYFLREMKEAGLIDTRWISGTNMRSDTLTKNLSRKLFNKHNAWFVGHDKYMDNG